MEFYWDGTRTNPLIFVGDHYTSLYEDTWFICSRYITEIGMLRRLSKSRMWLLLAAHKGRMGKWPNSPEGRKIAEWLGVEVEYLLSL